ncbi:hypothetical protein AKO1_015837 [Acrasis kona]|uniref:DUF4832 domain-containing protein n=1 Tax=Acrasis kona TaxID=1008807 RepID=A0AAW2ZIS8_9EUKA
MSKFFYVLLFVIGYTYSQYSSTFTQDNNVTLLNPERGFLSLVETQSVLESPSPLSDFTMNSLLSNNILIVQRIWYIKAFINTDLSTSQLQLVSNDFNMARKYNFKVIPRFTYSQSSTESDANMTVIQRHISQLAPIIKNNSDIIAVFQAGFIGSYGEWYYSSNNLNNNGNYTLLVNTLLSVLPQDRTVQIRTPSYKQNMFNVAFSPYSLSGPPTGIRSTNYSRVGVHNDCFLADATDYGTYINAYDRQWLANESIRIPFGGETCAVSSYSVCDNAKKDLSLFHTSFLNINYNQDVITSWRNGGCFNEIANRLGYRLSLIRSFVNVTNNVLSYSISFNNTGYAAPYNPYQIQIAFVNSTGVVYNVPLDHDVRYWTPELSPIVISSRVNLDSSIVSNGNYSLFIKICDPLFVNNSRYCIKLANSGMDVMSEYYGLKTTVSLQATIATPTPTPTATPSLNTTTPTTTPTSTVTITTTPTPTSSAPSTHSSLILLTLLVLFITL